MKWKAALTIRLLSVADNENEPMVNDGDGSCQVFYSACSAPARTQYFYLAHTPVRKP